mgnify:CR=1 FL=1
MEFLAGNRIRGTSAERSSFTSGTSSIDGSYTVLQFTESGTFKPTSTFDVDYLVVGGGGGGGLGPGSGLGPAPGPGSSMSTSPSAIGMDSSST